MSDENREPRDLEDEIFGEERQNRQGLPSENVDRGESVSDHQEDRERSREGSIGALPKFKKDSSNHLASQDHSYKANESNKKSGRNDQSGEEPLIADGEEEPIIDPEQQRRHELYARIDAAARKTAVKRRRKKNGDDDLEMMADEEVSRLRSRMLAAVSLDNESNEARRPATSKMMLLPIVTSTMQKSHLETALLDNGILEAVKKWLEPLPDRSLPALNIQRSLLQLLSKMSIDTQSLKSSELGKVVLFYTKCPRIDPGIKRMADSLVTTWLRPIIRRSASYRSRAPIPIASTNTTGSNLRRPAPSTAGNSQRTRVPETIHQAFHIAPASQLNNNDNEIGIGMGGLGGNSYNPAARKNSQKATAKKTREWARKVQDAKKGNRAN
ncbi:hypothetical protein PPACK8108_LOCUS2050 [Phakopsora pachyrhizi]|uniref:TFIIS N-terminal domain-containing protein n=1 Tax=Phakopsora pachyrhizi TaxID=170000 RepID=A0AAV0AGZ6_PHAPC|nr:hypothetical protein PPACK8108_LOCUS2050 [Phakopsora pachyrhizi]